ncbi:HAD family phosphatase [Phenylobacterium sp.]|uniref:HAD family hydrolase n=1 Tax=Phenylobacterium sp. TaxID=1871053 RepID=UPI002732B5C0|nr:HAD family phosphatase [Phenylobacterium sp.]MDP3659529.1 HAD family phosphatase [Phenylobacterium sp.]
MSLPRPVRAVVFDMDGLLVDSETLVFAALQGAAAGIDGELPFETFQRMVGLPQAASDLILLEHFGSSFSLEGFRDEVRERMHEALVAGACLKAGVVELLDHLDQIGLPCAIATSSSLESVGRTLGPSGLVPRFRALITRDVIIHGKPHPEPFLRAAEALDVDPADCLALEDSHNGVRAAHAAGMMTIMVPDLLDPTEEMQALCVRIAADLHEVEALLRDGASV